MKWGLPSSVENSGSEDALSEELVIDPMINEMIPNSGILDQPSALYTDYKPTMGLDGESPCIFRGPGFMVTEIRDLRTL